MSHSPVVDSISTLRTFPSMLGWNGVPRELTDCSRALLDVLTSSWEEKAGMVTCITYWLPDD